MSGRQIPYDQHAEQSLIGAVFESPDALDDVLEIMHPADVFVTKHRYVLEAAIAVHSRNEKPDLITVATELEKNGQLDAIGGRAFLEEAEVWTPAAANVRVYARIIREKAQLRGIIEASHASAQEAYEAKGEVGEIVDRAEARQLAVRERGAHGSEVVDGRALMRLTIKEIERDYERGVAITGTPTGIPGLDSMTSGFQAGELVILAARPGQGKTTAGLNWADHVAVEWKRAALVLSMEMPLGQVGKRQLAARARVDLQRLKTGQLIESDWARQAKAAGEISGSPWLETDCSRNLSALEVRAKARRAKRRWANTETPLGLVLLDYLTLMKEDENAETKSVAVGKNAGALKSLALELDVPVVCLAQLNRDNSKGGKPRRPVLSDLRDSGEIEQHADAVIFLHHEQDKDNERPDEVEIIIEKQRNGPTGTVRASHLWSYCRIESLHGGRSGQRDWTEVVPHSAEHGRGAPR